MSAALGAIGSLAPKLFELLKSEYGLQKNLKKKVEFVHGELENIQAALRKVSTVPWDELDEQLQVWSRQIRDASYDMEDALDTFLVRVEGGERVSRSKVGGMFGKLKARRDISKAIDDIEQKLQKVADWRTRYTVDDIVANYSAHSADPRLLNFYKRASELVGIDTPRDELIEMLSLQKDDVDTSSSELKIISIVGIGGLGKSTLAKAVYDKVYHQFDCGVFVPVGCHPDPNKVLRDILIDLVNDVKKRKCTICPDQMIDLANDAKKRITAAIDDQGYTGDDLRNMDQRQLIDRLRSFLDGKRYFIVIDDIWDTVTWGTINAIFVDSNLRSRVIATTRNSNVSKKIGKLVYIMKKLSENQSRKLLYTRTFDGVEENWPDEDKLDVIVSQRILHRCDGVPLAIVTIGSLLAGKKIDEWPNVYDSVGFSDGDDTQVNNMKKILSFSYYDLPYHLRTCMLYLGMFPEDYSVHRDQLIFMWIAEGLVQQTKKEKDLFNVGESYFLELINRGMIQPLERYGFLIGCRVHDMILHMIRDLSREELFLTVQEQDSSKEETQANGIRRLALHEAKPIQVNDKDMKKVRYLNVMYCGTDMIPPVAGFKLLRVLSLVSCPLEGHLDTRYLGKLLHLRYLSLESTPVRELPKDIGHLKFMQTLILTGTGIEELPTSLGQLTQLMCLWADDETRGPDWIGKLTSLVNLDMFFAADDKCFVKELGNLRNLRILRTEITLQDKEQVREFLLSLGNLKRLESIIVTNLKHFAYKDAIMQPSLFVLCCNNLRVLRLDKLRFNRMPEWINPQALPKLWLLSLYLSALYQQDMEILGNFKQLCVLGIHNNSSFLTKVSISGGGRFQNLKQLVCSGVQFVQGAMPVLEVIEMRIPVCIIKDDDYRLDFRLRNLPALQKVIANIDCTYCLPKEVVEVEVELMHTFNNLPNRPTIKIGTVGEDQMVNSSDSEIERQKKKVQRQELRARRLRQHVKHYGELYDAMGREVAELGTLTTNLNLSGDIKNKVQGFHQQFAATAQRARHKEIQAQDDTHMHDHRDLNKMMKGITALEEALEIITLGYPRLAAMLDDLKYALSLQGATPSPQVINLYINVPAIKLDNLCLDFGLIGKISSLQGIKAHVMCYPCFPTEVHEVEIKLKQAIDNHYPNNPPTLEIIRYDEDKMMNSDSNLQMLERKKWRAGRLWGRIQHQRQLHSTLSREACEMVQLKSDINLSSDAEHKKQRFVDHFNATVDHVKHELRRVTENIPIPDRDIKRVTEDTEDMERALGILTVEYPWLVAMLEELKSALGYQGATPSPQVINLYISVPDIKLDNLCLDFGLIGKISSLQGIKAHVMCYPCFPTEVHEVETKLKQAIDNHHPNNPPTLEIIRYDEDKMMNSDSNLQMLERKKWRARRLWGRIQHQRQLHSILSREAFEMFRLKSDMNLSGDAEHKKQRFDEHFNATVVRVQHKLLRVKENVPIPDRDIKRVTEDTEDMERALGILTVEYPWLVAMLEELKSALGYQGATPSPQVINLYISVPDIKLDNLCLDFGLIGKISSLQGIKAHVMCYPCFPTEVHEVETKLKQAIDNHHPNNPPTLEIIRYDEDKMLNSDSNLQMLERKKWRAGRLWGRIQHQKQLHSILSREACKMVQLKSDMNLSGDAEYKKQRFVDHFNATVDRVKHELRRVTENIPMPDRDIKRVTEDTEDMEQALEILTVEYPRLAQMVEELKSAVSFQAVDEDEDGASSALLDREEEEDEVTKEVVSAASVSELEL